jgi:hypothetical protein
VADDVVNLEDETPAPVAEVPPEAPPAEAGPAEVDAVEVGGQKYVPVAALIAERAEKKTLKEQAQRASVLEQENAQMRPYAQFLAAHPELMNPQPRQAPAPQQPVVDAEALQYAKELDLYKADGNPDIEKAQRLIALQDQRAARKATEAVQPYAQSIEQQQSVHNFQNALTIKGASGQTPTRRFCSRCGRASRPVSPRTKASPRCSMPPPSGSGKGRRILWPHHRDRRSSRKRPPAVPVGRV